ncbi:MAG: hypothetical protein ACFCU6_14690 [Balneolaceae bacterium]
MRGKIVHIIFWLLLAGSGFFFVLSVIEIQQQRTRTQQAEQLQERMREEIPFYFDEVVESLTPQALNSKLSPKEYENSFGEFKALILLHPGVCPACILETHEYIDVFDSFGFSEIQPVIIVLEDEERSAENFLKRSMFKTDAYFGRHDSLEELTRILDDQDPIEQIIAFVDTAQKKVFYRSIIPTRVTSLASKQTRLEEIFSNYNINK